MGNENGKVSYVKTLPSKLDLLRSAQNHYSFVQELNFNPHLFHPKVINYAIFRYQRYWLPFAAKHADKMLVAPIDLELVWVAHILDKEAYTRDCMKMATKLIPHTVATFQRRLKNEATVALWEASFAKKVPLYIDHKRYPEDIPPYDNIVSTNLIAGIEKYRLFSRQVSLPHFKDPKFLQTAFYLYLQEAVTADKERQPRTDLEFIWKTHKLTPTAYAIDGNELRERMGTKIRQYHSLRNKPNPSASYDNPMASLARGTVSRGNIVPFIPMLDKNKLESLSNKTFEFHIMGYRLANLYAGKNYRLRIRTKSLLTKKETNCQTLRVKAEGSIVFKTFLDKSEDTMFVYNSANADVVQIRLSEINMMHSSIQVDQNSYDAFNFDYDFFNCDEFSEEKETKLEFAIPATVGHVNDDNEPSWLRLRCEKITVGDINLFFATKKSHVSKSDHFCNVLCHPSLMAPHFTKKNRVPCVYVSRTLKDRRNETIFKCRILRSSNGEFCSTEVFDFNEKLICSSYTVGQATLPHEDQVWKAEKCCVLREQNEKVYVLRSTNVEWGLLKVFVKRSNNNDIIPTQMIFMNLKDIDLTWVSLYDKEEAPRVITYKGKGIRLSIDLQNGRLSIPPSVHEFPELLSLGVTILSIFYCFRYRDALGAGD